jgi:menaquinone-9 beta-reductase
MRDVIIIGAGPGGAAAATFLANSGTDVLLLDRADFPRDKTCGDGLTPRCVAMLEELGVLQEVGAFSHRINSARIIAPNGRCVETTLKPHGRIPDYMLVSPRYQLDEALLRRAISSGAHFRGGVKVTAIQQQQDGVKITTREGQEEATYAGRLAIIATGASQGLLKKSGLIDSAPQPIIAARAYYEGVRGIGDAFDFHFDGVALPGYGWLFPLGEGRANIGLGYMPDGKAAPAKNIKKLLAEFVSRPVFAPMLATAKQTTAFESYPIRTDFATARTYMQRTIVVGEAAGLVNPLTGEGIDYALESGKIAAQHATQWLADDDFGSARLAAYDRALRDKYQLLFDYCTSIVGCCVKPFTLNLMITAAAHSSQVRESLTDIILGNRTPSSAPTAWNMTRKALKALVNR